MKNPLTLLKEKCLTAGVKALLNREIEKCGVVTDLAIDTAQKTIQVALKLKKKPTPLLVKAGSYELSEQNGAIHIGFYDVSSSKEWITAVLNKYAVGRRFQLPRAAKILL